MLQVGNTDVGCCQCRLLKRSSSESKRGSPTRNLINAFFFCRSLWHTTSWKSWKTLPAWHNASHHLALCLYLFCKSFFYILFHPTSYIKIPSTDIIRLFACWASSGLDDGRVVKFMGIQAIRTSVTNLTLLTQIIYFCSYRINVGYWISVGGWQYLKAK